jgi:alkanesulfonate monooxygenase SsuD/methylene tetrahydromethanopterin reductase-like flavin-dependent oxidoreductase (luciferase family)
VRRAEAIGRSADELRERAFAGTPDEVVATLHAYRELGVSRACLQVLDLADLDHLGLIAAEVTPQVR